jgi:3D (Asp-Asp-Asp) domain-containing protein
VGALVREALRRRSGRGRTALALAHAALLAAACATPAPRPAPRPQAPAPAPPAGLHELRVTATAFNSVAAQTDGQPALTASGERLVPGQRALAISPDLEREGLALGSVVEVEGLAGEWRVLDRMAPRWRRRIDVYMGLDEAAARRFGKRTVTIRWRPDP